MANPTTSYVQNENPYLYCATCGRKDYNLDILNQTATNNGAVSANNNQGGLFRNNKWVAPTVFCNAYNSAPAIYPVLASNATTTQGTATGNQAIGTGYCQGTMTLTTATLGTLDNQTYLNERATS